MARPLNKYPRRNVVSFRLSDPEFEVIQYLVDQCKNDGETFGETVGRIVKSSIMVAAQKRFLAFRETMEKSNAPHISLTREEIEGRRQRYLQEFTRACYAREEEAKRKAPRRVERAEFALSSVVVARPEEGAQLQAEERGQATEKIENLASPSGSEAQRASESAGKLE